MIDGPFSLFYSAVAVAISFWDSGVEDIQQWQAIAQELLEVRGTDCAGSVSIADIDRF